MIEENIILISYKLAKSEKFCSEFECLEGNYEWLHSSTYQDSQGVVAIDKDEDIIVGYGFISDQGLVYDFEVDEDYRGRGLGTRMFKYLLRLAKKNSISEENIWIELARDNEVGYKFWTRLGFEPFKKIYCYNNDIERVPGYAMKYHA